MSSSVTAGRLHKREIAINSLLASVELATKGLSLTAQRPEGQQKALAALLISAQEEERSRISRELHDDIAQQLTLICIEIDRVKTSMRPKTDSNTLDELLRKVKKLCLRVRALSHELHSPELDLLGLGPAISTFCQEFSRAHNLDVFCDSSILPKGLASDVSLAFYRVTQEALQNVAKHSGAQKALVQIEVENGGLLLRIQDFGCGFQVESISQSSHLGLRSMCERIRSIGGSLVIHSNPGEGTIVEARVRHVC